MDEQSNERFEAARNAYFVAGMKLAWYRGWEAFYAGKRSILDNPYERWSPGWQDWGEGWIAAYAYEDAKEEGWIDA